ncbi:dihydroflavonol-4-reductase [Trypanosoma rangeli]|uniref:Dihydroflavonol-4-reductase n=1 Tax=Trypanosoma rangeli TaxID=5698 RepID=A0A422NNP8_TRYRA|nr:dihydroflavonol-4-reductase [Trypanosoma rangeli]RNF07046.1 dihydroflavonol-4-reductase [Trypanosoma rangeli]|eukprot:RNF07046.1 dihydroflavonol-4-reductase [Trypanosoma rangeli]
MLRAFSGSCLSLEDMKTVRRPNLVQRPHILGPGVDFFTEDGQPVRPQPGAHTLQKVFSGSTLDLNAMNGDVLSEEEVPQTNNALQHSQQQYVSPVATVSTILHQLSTETEKERAKSSKNKTNVLVIGGIGYISSHVVAKLLDAGYTVRVTVADGLSEQQQMDFYSMDRGPERRLTILEADMTDSSTLRDAMRGCKYVIHCGCPTAPGDKDPVGLHTSAIRALFDAVRSTGQSTVKRVVITGASSSVFHITDPDPPSGAFDESCWNTVATSTTDPIPYARICFEKEAWRIKQMIGVELVVVLPSITIGPSRTEEISDAMMQIQELANASPVFPYAANLYWNYVDVRDVAEAHVRALECQEVKDQRVIVSNGCFSYAEVAQMIKEAYPHLTPPTRTANTLMTLLIGATQSQVKMGFLWRFVGVRKRLQTHRAKVDLDMTFTPMKETIQACIDQLIRAGEIPAPNASRSMNTGKIFIVTTAVSLFLSTAVAVAWGVARARRRR